MIFFKKKEVMEKSVMGISIRFFDKSWINISRDLDDGTTAEQAQLLANKIKNQILINGVINIGGKDDCLSNTLICLENLEMVTVDIAERGKGNND